MGKDIWLVLLRPTQVLGFNSCFIIGNLIYSSLLGIDMIIINSETVARELLDKRSAIYSDRPVFRTSELYAIIHLVLDILTS